MWLGQESRITKTTVTVMKKGRGGVGGVGKGWSVKGYESKQKKKKKTLNACSFQEPDCPQTIKKEEKKKIETNI